MPLVLGKSPCQINIVFVASSLATCGRTCYVKATPANKKTSFCALQMQSRPFNINLLQDVFTGTAARPWSILIPTI